MNEIIFAYTICQLCEKYMKTGETLFPIHGDIFNTNIYDLVHKTCYEAERNG